MDNFFPYDIKHQSERELELKLKPLYARGWFFLFRIWPWVITAICILGLYLLPLKDDQFWWIAVFELLVVFFCIYLLRIPYVKGIVIREDGLRLHKQRFYQEYSENVHFSSGQYVVIRKQRGRNQSTWEFYQQHSNGRKKLFSIPIRIWNGSKDSRDNFRQALETIAGLRVEQQ